MGFLNDIESSKCRFVSELIKNDEAYDKKRNSLTGIETFELLHERYLKIEEALNNLKERFGPDTIITDIGFGQGMQEYSDINIKYLKGDKKNYLSISNLGYGQYEISGTDKEFESETFIINNRKIIRNIFQVVDENNIDDRITVNSTSKKLVVSDLGFTYSVSDADKKAFSIITGHNLYQQSKAYLSNLECNYPKLRELLDHEETIIKLYSHIRFYEEDIEKVLTKN